jgi:hypothetical protein
MWHEMSFFTQWLPGHSMVLCIGVPDKVYTRLASALAESISPLNFADPFSMHVPLLDQMIILYDESVWQIRHMIRRREEVLYIALALTGRVYLIAFLTDSRKGKGPLCRV